MDAFREALTQDTLAVANVRASLGMGISSDGQALSHDSWDDSQTSWAGAMT